MRSACATGRWLQRPRLTHFAHYAAVLGPWFEGDVPSAWKRTLEAEGCDLQLLLADSWGEHDAPNRMANCGKLLKCSAAATRTDSLSLAR